MEVYAAGWKAPSLVDVKGRTSFTLWLCGCNLRCPYCHNHRVAEGDPRVCRATPLDRIVEALRASARLLDCLHVTGGEPLLQDKPLRRLLVEAERLGLTPSIATNCTLPDRLARLVHNLGHAAVDLKAPPEDHPGLPPSKLRSLQLECLSLLASHGVEVELRIPLQRLNTRYAAMLEGAVREAAERLRGTRWYIVVVPLVSGPLATPRDPDWCRTRCNPERRDIELAVGMLRRYNDRVYIAPHRA